ncbi:MAG: hypothetical protein Q9227_003074 [Pyrenula ochraceoflavens]
MAESASSSNLRNLGDPLLGEPLSGGDDPFVSDSTASQNPHPHRYSAFDTMSMSLNSTSSPSQVKRTLETHLAETERRLQEASKLGTSLVQQRQELTDKLQEVERQQDEAEITPELRERLAALEKEYNEVGKESARAILAPKSRVVSLEERQSAGSPVKYESQASASPTKVSVPSRKQRNQQSSRVGDIQFAADISTSLLAQVRQLQALLAEREDALKSVNLEKSRLELEAEGFNQRLRILDESEQRYKDENWNLETQTHELMATAKEAADREKKLNTNLSAALAEKTQAESELDDLKLANGKLLDEHTAAKKAHDSEVHTMRRNLDVGDLERSSLQKKIDELTSQNQELAKFATARFRQDQTENEKDLDFLDDDLSKDLSTPEHSPPPSPSKATPRHGTLDSETLRNSLHHAHRMIQNLKNNMHREKTDKMELKRMLQDARDELETRRSDGPGSGAKRQKSKSEVFKKPPRPDMLGASRRSRTDFEMEDAEWEDHHGHESPSQRAAPRHGLHTTELSDAYHTANETDAFETANEKDTTESEAFETGAESLAGDSTDELTETESRSGQGGTLRAQRPSKLSLRKPGDRSSYMSTASTSADEDEIRTPVQSQPQKYQLKMRRGLLAGRSRGSVDIDSNPASAKNSPAGCLSNRSTPAPEGNNLFAELGQLNGVGSDGEYSTPARSSIVSDKSTPAIASASRKSTMPIRPEMVDSSMMTEPWDPTSQASTNRLTTPSLENRSLTPGEKLTRAPSPSQFPLPPSHPGSPQVWDANSQFTPHRGSQESPLRHMSNFITPPKTIWDEDIGKDGAQQVSDLPIPEFSISDINTIHTGPELHPASIVGPKLEMSDLASVQTEPIRAPESQPHSKSLPVKDSPPPTPLSFSQVASQDTVPVAPEKPAIQEKTLATSLVFSPISAQNIPPAVINVNRPSTAEKIGTGGGVLSSVGAALGLVTTKDQTSKKAQKDLGIPSEETFVPEPDQTKEVSPSPHKAPDSYDSRDQGSQTILSSEQIDQALMQKTLGTTSSDTQSAAIQGLAASAASLSPNGFPPRLSSKSRPRSADDSADGSLPFPTKRPGSAASQRASPLASHPPLPADHRQAIAAASSKSSMSPIKGAMGPPTTPASAYKRPQTPKEKLMQSPVRDGTTPRARVRQNSQISRRSSVSSFASELDERFNIRTDALPNAPAFDEPGTDPRMIQAITQTMIGEFLWKYTRKAGRGEMSSTRHRRYFWVHPYTRTLYWSDQDPQAGGRSELRAKSVPIEAVRVISDDNPLPPGLHRKSIEIVTPGRRVKFTATTGQRHDTWFNALSYLLLRSQERINAVDASMDPSNITNEDLAEFNPAGNNRYSASRASLSSYNSRATRDTTVRASSRLSLRQPTTSGTATSRQPTTPEVPPQESLAQRSISRISSYFRPGTVTRGSMASRRQTARSRHLSVNTADGSIYNASVVDDGVRDSEEETRKEMLKAEKDAHRLEDVRACCDDTRQTPRAEPNKPTVLKAEKRLLDLALILFKASPDYLHL